MAHAPRTTFDEVIISVFSGTAQAANAGPHEEAARRPPSVTGGNIAVGPGQGTWTAAVGITFSNTHAANATANGLQVGDNVLGGCVIDPQWFCGTTTWTRSPSRCSMRTTRMPCGDDQELCSPAAESPRRREGSSPQTDPATGTWTLVSPTGTITTPSSPTSQVTGLAVGPNVFRWTVSNGPCGVGITSDEVSITLFDSSVSGSQCRPGPKPLHAQHHGHHGGQRGPSTGHTRHVDVGQTGGGNITSIHYPAPPSLWTFPSGEHLPLGGKQWCLSGEPAERPGLYLRL